MIFIEHELTAHLPTEVIKSFEIDEDGEIKEEIEAESHRPEHTMGDRVSCSCGEEWEGVKAEEEAKKHLRKVTTSEQIQEQRGGQETVQTPSKHKKQASWSSDWEVKDFHLEVGDTGFQVSRWEDELVEEVESALEDMAELQGKKLEAETASFTAKLILNVTDGDWKQAEGMASVLEDFFRNQTPGSEVKVSNESVGQEEEVETGEDGVDESEKDSDEDNEVIISSE